MRIGTLQRDLPAYRLRGSTQPEVWFVTVELSSRQVAHFRGNSAHTRGHRSRESEAGAPGRSPVGVSDSRSLGSRVRHESAHRVTNDSRFRGSRVALPPSGSRSLHRFCSRPIVADDAR